MLAKRSQHLSRKCACKTNGFVVFLCDLVPGYIGGSKFEPRAVETDIDKSFESVNFLISIDGSIACSKIYFNRHIIPHSALHT